MPQVIACPSCPTRIKVPDGAGGRRVKCPKCGGVMTVPSGPQPSPPPRATEAIPTSVVVPPPSPDLPPPDEFDPPALSHPSSKRRVDEPPVRATRPPMEADDRPASSPIPVRPAPADHDSDIDDILRPRRRAAAEAKAAKSPASTADTGGPLHPGWKSVALGYRMFGVKMLLALLGGLGVITTFVLVEGWAPADRMIRNPERFDSDSPLLLVPMAVAGVTAAVVALFSLLGHIFLMGMPNDRLGGKGKGLAGLMFILLLVGLAPVSALLLPAYSAGIGTALGKPRLTKYGWGLYVWYLVGLVVLPLLAGGTFLGVQMFLAAEPNNAMYAALGAGVIALVLGAYVYLSVWGTFVGLRRGISASVRERGISVGGSPNKAMTSRDREGEEDRSRRRSARDGADDAPRAVKVKRPTDDDDSDDDLPRSDRRRSVDDSDSDHDRPRKRS